MNRQRMLAFFYTAALSIALSTAVLAGDVFEGPEIKSYRTLTPKQHEVFKRASQAIMAPNYVTLNIAAIDGRNDFSPSFFKVESPSFYMTAEGRTELQAIAGDLLRDLHQFSNVIFVGRSGQGIRAYLQGALDASPHPEQAEKLRELPYSNNDPRSVTPEQKQALRRYLEAQNLSPQKILSLEKPVLFMDIIFSGTGIDSLLKTLHDWAKEIGVPEGELKSKIAVYGAYPVHTLVVNSLMKLNHSLIGEGSPIKITKERVFEEIRGRSMPGYASSYAALVYERRASVKFYEYAGNLAKKPNESFTPDQWSFFFRQDTKPKLCRPCGRC